MWWWLVCVIAIDDYFEKFRLLLLLLVSVFSHRDRNKSLQHTMSIIERNIICMCAVSITESCLVWRRNRLARSFQFGKLISISQQDCVQLRKVRCRLKCRQINTKQKRMYTRSFWKISPEYRNVSFPLSIVNL